MNRLLRMLSAAAAATAATLGAGAAAAVSQEPLRVVATVPDLGDLARQVGGDAVAVETLVRGPEDPHFALARPSMVRTLAKADALVLVGLELEIGWLPPLVQNARNVRIQPAAPGFIDASIAVQKRNLPASTVDRSQGDVHVQGNPHYLLDPLCGLQVAELLRDRFAALRPAAADAFAANCTAFRERLCRAMVGDAIAAAYENDVATLAQMFERGELDALLRQHGDLERLGGWFGAMRPHRGVLAVADHDLWPYFAARFSIEVVGFFEPRPGIAPTSRHLEQIVATMKARDVRLVLGSPYFPPQHAEFVARATGARIAALAHQVGSLPGCDDYVATIDHDVRAVVAALAAGSR